MTQSFESGMPEDGLGSAGGANGAGVDVPRRRDYDSVQEWEDAYELWTDTGAVDAHTTQESTSQAPEQESHIAGGTEMENIGLLEWIGAFAAGYITWNVVGDSIDGPIELAVVAAGGVAMGALVTDGLRRFIRK